MHKKNFRTDLAMEATEIFNASTNSSEQSYPSGVEVTEESHKELKITKVKISSNEGQRKIGKPIGTYVTLEAENLAKDYFEDYKITCNILANELSNLMNIQSEQTVLIVGLGNWNITSDSLGPKVVSEIFVTRHILEFADLSKEHKNESLRSVSAISPGVLGITGIETFEIVKGVVDSINPSLIIVVDALASRRARRISTTIQIADTGISPGSGVGNKRKGLTKESLGVPVIAIGVPTVIDAATLSSDAIEMMLEEIKNNSSQFPEELNVLKKLYEHNDLNLEGLINKLIEPYYQKLIVTPKEIDEIVQRVSNIIAEGINISLGIKEQFKIY